MYGKPRTVSGRVVVSADTPGALPEGGYLYPAVTVVRHPVTGEVLAAWPGKATRCNFRAETTGVTCLPHPGETLPDPLPGNLLMSGEALTPGQRVDVAGPARA